jgi:hypothetical protein
LISHKFIENKKLKRRHPIEGKRAFVYTDRTRRVRNVTGIMTRYGNNERNILLDNHFSLYKCLK